MWELPNSVCGGGMVCVAVGCVCVWVGGVCVGVGVEAFKGTPTNSPNYEVIMTLNVHRCGNCQMGCGGGMCVCVWRWDVCVCVCGGVEAFKGTPTNAPNYEVIMTLNDHRCGNCQMGCGGGMVCVCVAVGCVCVCVWRWDVCVCVWGGVEAFKGTPTNAPNYEVITTLNDHRCGNCQMGCGGGMVCVCVAVGCVCVCVWRWDVCVCVCGGGRSLQGDADQLTEL